MKQLAPMTETRGRWTLDSKISQPSHTYPLLPPTTLRLQGSTSSSSSSNVSTGPSAPSQFHAMACFAKMLHPKRVQGGNLCASRLIRVDSSALISGGLHIPESQQGIIFGGLRQSVSIDSSQLSEQTPHLKKSTASCPPAHLSIGGSDVSNGFHDTLQGAGMLAVQSAIPSPRIPRLTA